MEIVHNFFKIISRNLIRILINTVFLASSCFFSVNFIIVLFQKALFEWVVAIFAIFIEIYFQYSLYLAEKRKQEGKRWAARGLKFQYLLIYVLIYCHLSGLGFFLTEIQSANVILRRQEIVESSNINRINQIDREIETLNLHLEKEAETGFGRRSESIARRIDELRKERETLIQSFEESSQVADAKVVKNSFRALADAFGSSENFLQLIVFETIMAIIYIGLYVTRWRPEELLGIQRTEKSFKLPQNKTSKKKESFKESFSKSFKESSRKTSQEENFPESFEQSFPGTSESLAPKVLITEKNFSDSLSSPKPQSEWERFVRASIRESGNLNSAKRVSMLTGIPIERCLEYRKRLEAMTIDGELVVETVQGGSRVRFDRDVILERVREAEKRAIEIIAARQ